MADNGAAGEQTPLPNGAQASSCSHSQPRRGWVASHVRLAVNNPCALQAVRLPSAGLTVAELLALDMPKHADHVRVIGSDAGNQAHIERSIQVGRRFLLAVQSMA